MSDFVNLVEVGATESRIVWVAACILCRSSIELGLCTYACPHDGMLPHERPQHLRLKLKKTHELLETEEVPMRVVGGKEAGNVGGVQEVGGCADQSESSNDNVRVPDVSTGDANRGAEGGV